eukprot:350595-Chlamydomonas_euryale.AAC.1
MLHPEEAVPCSSCIGKQQTGRHAAETGVNGRWRQKGTAGQDRTWGRAHKDTVVSQGIGDSTARHGLDGLSRGWQGRRELGARACARARAHASTCDSRTCHQGSPRRGAAAHRLEATAARALPRRPIGAPLGAPNPQMVSPMARAITVCMQTILA